MAQIKSNSERFNRDLLDDGVLGPEGTPPAAISSSDDFDTDDREARLARLRAEIQIAIDEEEAGLGTIYATADDLFNAIIAKGFNEDDDPIEDAGDHAQGQT